VAVAQSVYFACGLRATEFVFVCFVKRTYEHHSEDNICSRILATHVRKSLRSPYEEEGMGNLISGFLSHEGGGKGVCEVQEGPDMTHQA
jgi:hypothetical protein